MTHHDAAAAARLLEGMLARTHLSGPADVAEVVVSEARDVLGAADVVLYLVNLEQTALVPAPAGSSPDRSPHDVDGSVAGRCYATSSLLSVPGSGPGRRRVYVPVLDGTDRLGVLELEVDVDDDELPEGLMLVLERYAHASAQLIVSKRAYGDAPHLVQRSRPMELGAELLSAMLPPSTFATDGLVISAMLEPVYAGGGDAYDYAVNGSLAHLAILDAVGHGLAAAGLSTFAVAAYRHSRRSGLDLPQTYAAMDDAVLKQFGRESFVTGALAELDLDTGALCWVNAGHPPPLVLRDNRVVRVLDAPPATPLGLPMYSREVHVGQEQLEPGDVLVLYTDGVTEARRPDGSLLGVDGLVEFVRNESAAQQSPPETLRRLRRALLTQGTELRDDATVVLVDWRRGTETMLLPATVEAGAG